MAAATLVLGCVINTVLRVGCLPWSQEPLHMYGENVSDEVNLLILKRFLSARPPVSLPSAPEWGSHSLLLAACNLMGAVVLPWVV
jgi:hypothetical protein